MSLTVFNASRPRGIIQQLIPPSQDNPRACETFNNMLVATWKRKRYVNDDLMSKKGSRGRTSWIAMLSGSADDVIIWVILSPLRHQLRLLQKSIFNGLIESIDLYPAARLQALIPMISLPRNELEYLRFFQRTKSISFMS
ncbi:hypothetical protein PT974_05131 [Cladobotryum mycophilum]|uniref:LAGLIDADG endonuclease n=1 Tax=Cladobotryum mycophilum TaxID=491253 RepID=A0ABR0SR41_9HYPO